MRSLRCLWVPWRCRDLEATIEAVPCDTVIVATPMNLEGVVRINKPTVTVSGEGGRLKRLCGGGFGWLYSALALPILSA